LDTSRFTPIPFDRIRVGYTFWHFDNTLINYPTTASVQANFLTKSDAAATYQTGSQVDSKISTALIPYSTSTQVDSKISTALVPYRLLTNPDNKIQSTDGNT
jgi:hypothetical protein